ncbi:MAG TPA: NYN domain-containing protein [Flexilinea sp.]|nr:NYN domain-containing protein [Flexilinea sp.]HOG22846.1 NYN domain-containing protein [Flexilinea sp.]HOP00612.1 NYN domain-containing protein [Flexilinea sp.]HOR56422.1 NYN domain-containing protein [Flexilinea sp.]HOU19823.1 NYN domain-containing protein [Flexilinea sp.]
MAKKQEIENNSFTIRDITDVTPAQRIAVLIDGDNAQASLIDKILAEITKYGLITIRRIYGDWTASNMSGWKDVLQTHAIQPIQQFRYTTGKNATDSAMIIDAMDIFYSGTVDAFCLVSSDSDYTRLATRIREQGLFVMGIGKKTTPRAFVNACDLFVYTENLVPQNEPLKSTGTTANSAHKKKTAKSAESSPAPDVENGNSPDPLPLLRSAFDLATRDNGWAFLGTLGHHLQQLDPGFDSRTFGYRQLSLLIQAYPDVIETKEVKGADGTSTIYARLKS